MAGGASRAIVRTSGGGGRVPDDERGSAPADFPRARPARQARTPSLRSLLSPKKARGEALSQPVARGATLALRSAGIKHGPYGRQLGIERPAHAALSEEGRAAARSRQLDGAALEPTIG